MRARTAQAQQQLRVHGEWGHHCTLLYWGGLLLRSWLCYRTVPHIVCMHACMHTTCTWTAEHPTNHLEVEPTQTDTFEFQPQTQAPELYRHDPFCEAADVFSFGVVAYELLARGALVSTHVGSGVLQGVGSAEDYARVVAGGYRPGRPATVQGPSETVQGSSAAVKKSSEVHTGLWQLIQQCWWVVGWLVCWWVGELLSVTLAAGMHASETSWLASSRGRSSLGCEGGDGV